MNRVIITVSIPDMHIFEDVAVPKRMTVEKLLTNIIKEFSLMGIARLNTTTCRVECDKRILEFSKTMQENGVFDGSIISILK